MTPRQPVLPLAGSTWCQCPIDEEDPMVDFVTGLALSGVCAGSSRPRRCTCATTASGRSRWPTTTRPSPPRSAGSASRPGPAPSGATADLLPVDDESPGRPRRRLHAAGAGRPAGRRARPGRAVDQGRHAQPDRLVQGPGGFGRPDQGPRARLQGGGLRLDRQPGQLGGRPRGPGRAWTRWCSSRTTSRRPRSR